jgi:hypothetical protein
MKRAIGVFVCVGILGLVGMAAKASQDPQAEPSDDQSAAAVQSAPGDAGNAFGFNRSTGTMLERVKRGFAIAPVKLNLRGKDPWLVGLGSYIVNAQGACMDCHSNPPYLEGGNPFLGQPTKINTAGYLAGGQAFGPFISRNLTPFEHGRPAGLNFADFVKVMRTGVDLDHKPPFVPSADNDLLQVMPWPVYRHMRRVDLRAIYEYLRAIPPLPDGGMPPQP